MKILVVLSLIALGFATMGCVPRPRQDYTASQVTQINSLEEIMRVQAFDMDPLFGKRAQGAFSAAEFAAMVKAAGRMEATSQTLKEKFGKKFGQSFSAFAEQLHTGAQQLQEAAKAQKAAEVSSALDSMQLACKACHKKFK
jgi:cytochrome c556